HQYLGWLLAETGHTGHARAELDAALAIGVEIDDPDLTALALSFKGHLAWMRHDPQGVIALSRAALRDDRIFIAQHAYNAHQEARGWAMAGEPTQVDRILGHADELAERAVARQDDAPPNMYWYGSGFFALQRGLTWHTLKDARFADRAVMELTNGLRELPEAERHSEWPRSSPSRPLRRSPPPAKPNAPLPMPARRWRYATQRSRRGSFARCAVPTPGCATWPIHAPVHELGDELRPLGSGRRTTLMATQ
ncbi:MAG: hypothetical protein ACRDQH_18935, partial [Pseudonocardiaceae bacterium]